MACDEILLDLRGLKCPLPVLRTRKALQKARPGSVLIVSCTDPMTTIDLPVLMRETGDAIESQTDSDGFATFRIRKARSPSA